MNNRDVAKFTLLIMIALRCSDVRGINQICVKNGNMGVVIGGNCLATSLLLLLVLVFLFMGFLWWYRRSINIKMAVRESEVDSLNLKVADYQKQITKLESELQKHRQSLNTLVDSRTAELKKVIDKAEEANKLKTSFLINMSHEIRTPMNVILGFSSLLDDDELTAYDRKNFLEVIKTNGDLLLSIINGIQDISMLESKQIILNKTHFDLNTLLTDIYQSSKLMNEQNLKFEIDIPPTIESFELYSDASRIRQIVVNYLSNSFKFTSKGFVKLGYRLRNGEVVIFVADSGSGISVSDQESIFNHFRDAESDISKYYPGIGIGLSICKQLAYLLNGEVWFDSEVNVGSTFFLALKTNDEG
jgi:signal transduction histidine kinase